MNPTRKYLTRTLKSLIEFCHETGNEDLLLILAQATAKPEDPPIDRRRGTWSEARKAEHAEKTKKIWAARDDQAAKKLYESRYVGEVPTPIANIQHLCELAGIDSADARELVRNNPDGWLQYTGGFPVIYAPSAEACDKLRHSVYARTNNMEDIIHLQKRGSKRF